MKVSSKIASLNAWATEAEQEMQQITNEMAPLQKRLESAREKLDLLNRLIRLAEKDLLGDQPIEELVAERTEEVNSSVSPTSPPSPTPADLRTRSGLEENIEVILEKSGEPMHISEIRQALINQGVPLPGRGDEANVILRLRRAQDLFTRTGRGTYGLSEWGLAEVKPTTRKRKVRKKVAK